MISKNNEEWLTTKESALYLKISANALRILVHRKKILFYKLNSRLRFKKVDIINMIKEVKNVD